MKEFLFTLFPSDFVPHGYCYHWNPAMLWLQGVSDGLIALVYYCIPVMLIYFVCKRRDLPFNWKFLIVGMFLFGCGTTHLMEMWTIWCPDYWLAGFTKAATAGASLATAALLAPMVPRALTLPSPALLRSTNLALEREISERRRMED